MQRQYFANKGPSSQSYAFYCGHVWIWELDYKESWAPKNWCFELWCWRRLLRGPWTARRFHCKGNQSWILTGRTDAEAETPILWPPDMKNWLIWKDPDAGKDWRWEEKRMTEEEMVGWHHWLDRHEFEQAPRVGDGQGSLVCCRPWDHKESDTTEGPNWLTNWRTLQETE